MSWKFSLLPTHGPFEVVIRMQAAANFFDERVGTGGSKLSSGQLRVITLVMNAVFFFFSGGMKYYPLMQL